MLTVVPSADGSTPDRLLVVSFTHALFGAAQLPMEWPRR